MRFFIGVVLKERGLVRIGVDLDVWDSCSKKMVCRWIMFCCVVWLLVLD